MAINVVEFTLDASSAVDREGCRQSEGLPVYATLPYNAGKNRGSWHIAYSAIHSKRTKSYTTSYREGHGGEAGLRAELQKEGISIPVIDFRGNDAVFLCLSPPKGVMPAECHPRDSGTVATLIEWYKDRGIEVWYS